MRNYIDQRAGSRRPIIPGRRAATSMEPAPIVRKTSPTSPRETQNAYMRFDFGHDIGSNGMSIDGNIGVRFVEDDLSIGRLHSRTTTSMRIRRRLDPGGPRTPDAESRDHPRDFLPETAAFLEQAATPIVVDQEDTQWLPSLNVKWNLNDNMLVRFGASKALTRAEHAGSACLAARGCQHDASQLTRRSRIPNDPLFGVDRGAQDINLDRIVITRGNPDAAADRRRSAWTCPSSGISRAATSRRRCSRRISRTSSPPATRRRTR